MAEELGKIEKMPVEDFKKGRKLFFVAFIYFGEGLSDDYGKKVTLYWEQVDKQIAELSLKLGAVNAVYHELIASSGEAGVASFKELNSEGYKIAKACLEKNARLEALENPDLLSEFMDWSRCLVIGLQNPKVISKVYESYSEVVKKRNESIAQRINETLKENEIGIVFIRENHQVQFPSDIQVFYISPPALDDIKRWLREQEQKADKETKEK